MFLAHGVTQEMEQGHFPTPLTPRLFCEGWYPLLGLLLFCCDLSLPDPSQLMPRDLLHSSSLLGVHRITQFSLFGRWVGSSGQRASGVSPFWWLACRVVGLLLARSLVNGEPGPVPEDPVL